MGAQTAFTKREWFTLCTIGSVNFATAICVAIQAPFYPQEAESKGASATEYGLVFGIFEFVAFVSSPLFGKYMDSLGAKFLLICGIFVAGFSAVIFGLLDLVEGHAEFIGLSFAVRIVESLGASACLTASFSIIATVFPDRVATTFATLEVLYGVGYIVGPTIGGLLFTVGGYKLPFLVMGSFLIVTGVFIKIALPTIDDGLNKDRPQAQLWSFLKLTPVLLDSVSIAAAAIGSGYYSATLEPHLRQFGLTPFFTGLMFIISGGLYAVTAPVVGKLCDSVVYPKKMTVVGSLLVILSFLLVGPVPYTALPTTLWMVCLGLVVHGMGNSCILVPAFIDAIRSAVACGLPDDITTYGVVSGLWASSFALGAFVGPSAAGILFDEVGFREGTLFVIAVHACVFVAMTTYICLERHPSLPRARAVKAPADEEKPALRLVTSWTQDERSHPHYGSVAKHCNGDTPVATAAC